MKGDAAVSLWTSAWPWVVGIPAGHGSSTELGPSMAKGRRSRQRWIWWSHMELEPSRAWGAGDLRGGDPGGAWIQCKLVSCRVRGAGILAECGSSVDVGVPCGPRGPNPSDAWIWCRAGAWWVEQQLCRPPKAGTWQASCSFIRSWCGEGFHNLRVHSAVLSLSRVLYLSQACLQHLSRSLVQELGAPAVFGSVPVTILDLWKYLK
jgi:hypothetical protein